MSAGAAAPRAVEHLAGPFEVVPNGLPAGDALASACYIHPATGKRTTLSLSTNTDGAPVLDIPASLLASLAHGKSFKLSLVFRLTSSQPFGYTPEVLEGPFEPGRRLSITG
jgi:hypothetical protein